MRWTKRWAAAIFCMCFVLAVTACKNVDLEADPQETKSMLVEEPVESTVIEDVVTSYYIYVSVNGRDYSRYPFEADTVTPEALIAAISEMTGWNLVLAGDVDTGKDGLTVVFDDSAGLFGAYTSVGNEQFKVSSQEDLIAAILGSVQKTLKYYAAPETPETVNIYFAGKGNTPIAVDGVIDLPTDRPYSYEFWHEEDVQEQ